MNLLDWAGLAATTAGAALLYTLTVLALPFLRRRSSTVRRPTAGNPARHNHLDGCRLSRCRDCRAQSRRAAVTRARQSGRLAAPPRRFPVCQSGRRPRASRSHDPRLRPLLGWRRRRGVGEFSGSFGMKPGIEIATRLVAGVATAVVGIAGPPVLIYLLLVGASSRAVRATLLSFFAFAYAASLASHVVTVGIRTGTWLSGRDPDPLRLSRRPRRTASRRSGRRRRLCHPAHGSRALHPCRCGRYGCSLTITSRLDVTSRRGTVTDLGRNVYFYRAASPCSTAFADLEG